MNPAYHASMGEQKGRLTAFFPAAFIASLSVSAFSLITVGGFQINLAHVIFAAWFIAFMLTNFHDYWTHTNAFSAIPFLVCYSLYLLVTVGYLFFDRGSKDSESLILKYVFHFAVFCVLFVILKSSALSEASVAKAVYFGCPIGTLAFVAFATFVFLQKGRNFPLEFCTALVNGNLFALRFDIFLTLLNFNSDAIDRSQSSFVSIAKVNTAMGSFVLTLQLLWLYRRTALRVLPQLYVTAACYLSTITILLLVVGSTSRSNFVAILIAFAVVMAARSLITRNAAERRNLVLLSFFALCFLAVAVFVGILFLSGEENLFGRFDIETVLEDERGRQYLKVLRQIMDAPVWGHGLGAKVDGESNNALQIQVHNLFLAAWYEMGVAGLVTALLFYGCLILNWFHEFRLAIARNQHHLVLAASPAWFLSLPCLPLLRALIAGQGGNFNLSEWVCLAFFFAIGIRNLQAPASAVFLGHVPQIRSEGHD